MTKPYTLHLGDCIEVMRTLADNSIDAIVTDPPYELGFMGKSWDASGIANNVEMWREALRVLKPGGHLLAFSGTRTSHRMVCAIEDAGFEIRDSIPWLYGSGFPKSQNVSKAIDKQAGAERFVLSEGKAVKRMIPGADQDATGSWIKDNGREYVPTVTAAATPEAAQWEGWGTALKPAHEPCCMARKPLAKGLTVAGNVLAWGTGALNIDGCRVDFEGDADRAAAKPGGKTTAASGNLAGKAQSGADRSEFESIQGTGRWPANIIHDGSAEVVALFPAQAGASAPVLGTEASAASVGRVTGERERVAGAFHADTGSAARFFYCAKASRADRNAGTEQLPQKKGGMVSNTSGQHMTRRDDGYEAPLTGNNHPTVKPTDLMAYLCRLVTPPGGKVLDPFMGSGSTGKACMREGFEFVGIDMTAEYLPIATARIEHELATVTAAAAAAIEAQRLADAMPVQLSLLG